MNLSSFAAFLCLICLISTAGAKKRGGGKRAQPILDNTIEDVDEEQIDDLLEDGKHVLILFYESPGRCKECAEALQEVEEIDDELENADIAVVKTDDDNVAEELGVNTYPALVYFRRLNPILYDGDFSDSTKVLKWVLAHDEVVTEELDDSDFEDRTDSASPPDSALPWFIMFHDEKDEECSQYIPAWETVAHKLRGMVHVGRVDISESDDVADRFNVDDDEDCPTFLLLEKGKMYRYKDTAMDVKSFHSFALHKYKEQRGHRVPEPPFFIFETLEEWREDLGDLIMDKWPYFAGVGSLFGLIGLGVLIKKIRSRGSKEEAKED